MTDYDLIIIGGGGFGSSTAYHAARRGLKVLVLDQFSRNHTLGSSHGESRIIRKAYFEHPDYVPLLETAYDEWRQLEHASQHSLLRSTGLLLAGPKEGVAIPGARSAARLHGLDLESIPHEDWKRRFPGFRIHSEFAVEYETDGGVLFVEQCVEALLAQAETHGTTFRWNERVVDWKSDTDRVTVETEKGFVTGTSLVITAGAWSARLANEIPEFPELTVLRKVMFWFPVRSDVYDLENAGSGFYFEMPTGDFYGFPSLDGKSIKVCEHSGGDPVVDPANVCREVTAADARPVSEFVKQCLPDVEPKVATSAVCLYTMSPDQHFIVDRHPERRNVLFAAGFSGHGFKFVSALGKALAELVADGETALPIDFLGLARFRR